MPSQTFKIQRPLFLQKRAESMMQQLDLRRIARLLRRIKKRLLSQLFTIETVLAITTADFENSVDNLKKSEYNSLEKRRL